ncbi:sporulation related domain protein [Hydrogenophaga sp. RAC07]|mgnify:CR=1 FL=1|uniref:FecR family protein n=1 Tax=Hydrogenophaga sp. RAC07 TaxID=1842537 RepID=UPI00085594C6|nr:FecR family protein [Hydrogenophaga sp. RAC07]AOF86308.1 sporulation related domain protein [Hydrogenophaga sp. RAC07]
MFSSAVSLPFPAARFSRPFVRHAVGLLLLGAGLWASQGTARAATTGTVVEAIQLPAWVERNGQRRAAEPGVQLRATDKAITAGNARMLLRMSDRSTIKLGENSEFVIESLAVRQPQAAGPSELSATLRLVTGVFRYATDYSSKALGNKRDINLKMATATVGIRGTDFWSMSDAAHDAVCMFEGKVEVVRDAKPGVMLEKPGAFWVSFTGEPEKPAGQATPDQLAKFIGQAEMQPGQGIVLQGGQWRAVAGLMPSGVAANALRTNLQAAGYPAEVMAKDGKFEVRINQLATREDAEVVLKRLQANAALGVTDGRVALATR